MSPMIPINLDETPDKVQLVNPGTRVLKVVDVTANETAAGTVYNAILSVEEPGVEDNGRHVYDRFDFQYEKARIRFKQFVVACGHKGLGSGVDTSELIGANVRAVVAPRTYEDKDTGQTEEARNIKKYIG